MAQLKILFVGLALLLCYTNVYAEIDQKQAARDWAAMDKLLDEKGTFLYQSEFEKSPETFTQNWLDYAKRFTAGYTSFTEKYGKDRQALNEVFTNVTKPLEAKRDNYQLVNELTDFSVERQTKAILDWADRAGRQNYQGWKSMTNPAADKFELKLKKAQNALNFFLAAQMLNPEGNYSEFVQKAEKAVSETEPMVKKALESQVWPGHTPEYTGPGTADEIAAAALDFLRKNPNWTKPEYDDEHIPYAACVTGKDWIVYKRVPLTQQPTQYSINILVAFTGKKDPYIAYVYHMVFYTAEEAGVKKGLPLRYANSRQYAKYKMLLNNIPKGSAGGSSSSFGLWRVLVGLLLIVGGTIGAGEFVSGKIPQAKDAVSKLTHFTLPIGAALILFGLGGFFCNLFRLTPLASLLPQLAATCLGIIFLRKSPKLRESKTGENTESENTATSLPDKISDQLIKILAKFESLDNKELPSGFTALVLGILHLFIGSFTFL